MWLGIYGIKDASPPPSEGPVMSGLLAHACPEEPDALIALVRVCGGAPRVTGGSTRKSTQIFKGVFDEITGSTEML